MDTKDVRIFCEMAFKYLDYNAFTRRRISPSEIGRRLGLGEKTVRTRVKKMEREGFVRYYQAVPNLSLFGLGCMVMYGFEAVDVPSKRSAIEYIGNYSWMVEAFDMIGPGFLATLAGSSQREVQSRVDEIVGRLKLKAGIRIGDRMVRAPLSTPDRLDWRILQRLRYDAVAPAKDIADALSVTARMAEYRIGRLLESGAFFVRAVIDARRQRGLIFYGLSIIVDEVGRDRVVERVKETFGERLWSLFIPPKGIVVANLFTFSPEDPEESVMRVLGLEGVKHCSLSIFKEIVEVERPNWMDAGIERMLRSFAKDG